MWRCGVCVCVPFCCRSVDWYSAWPLEALRSTADALLADVFSTKSPSDAAAMARCCVDIHAIAGGVAETVAAQTKRSMCVPNPAVI